MQRKRRVWLGKYDMHYLCIRWNPTHLSWRYWPIYRKNLLGNKAQATIYYQRAHRQLTTIFFGINLYSHHSFIYVTRPSELRSTELLPNIFLISVLRPVNVHNDRPAPDFGSGSVFYEAVWFRSSARVIIAAPPERHIGRSLRFRWRVNVFPNVFQKRLHPSPQ